MGGTVAKGVGLPPNVSMSIPSTLRPQVPESEHINGVANPCDGLIRLYPATACKLQLPLFHHVADGVANSGVGLTPQKLPIDYVLSCKCTAWICQK